MREIPSQAAISATQRGMAQHGITPISAACRTWLIHPQPLPLQTPGLKSGFRWRIWEIPSLAQLFVWLRMPKPPRINRTFPKVSRWRIRRLRIGAMEGKSL
jgi:hypothetical protein